MINERIMKSLHALPAIEGPIPVSMDSVPFCSMKNSRVPLDLEKYGYVEEEYFIEGRANVYQEVSGIAEILYPAQPYMTRLLVRKPAAPSRFSGRVYFDIMNATQNYDIEDLWHRIYLWCMENGHGYVGITSKPVNVQSLKQYDYMRYKRLDWSAAEPVPQPAPCIIGEIPGTEEGLIWDMLGQTAAAIRDSQYNSLFDRQLVRELYLTGQSQSGFYLNTFIAHFDRYNMDESGKRLFDGYLNIVGVPFERELRQSISSERFSLKPRRSLKSRTPLIMISSEGDLGLFAKRDLSRKVCIPENSDTSESKCRYYEVAGAPHTDIDCPILSSDDEIRRAGRSPQPMNVELRSSINHFPLAEYVCGFLEKLHIWSMEGRAPACTAQIARDNDGELKRDSFSNALGGFRSPLVDLPTASYQGYSTLPEGDIGGRAYLLGEEQLKGRFGGINGMLDQLQDALLVQQNEGWLTPEAVIRIIKSIEEQYGR